MSVISAVRRAAVPAPKPPERPKPRHFPGLDGIRAIAVIAVMAYHFGLPDSAGGFLGVDLFFVLSGYLITGQLVTRWVYGAKVTGSSFRTFWAARARRLFPSLAVMLAATTAVVAVADRVQLRLYRGDVAAAATYTSNWWYIFHQRSYFVASGRPPLLQHLWSLAVEEQFYLVWPVLILAVILLVRRGIARQATVFALATVLMLGSAAVMGFGSALTHVPQLGDPSRWYFGTDSHSMGLLAGAALAALRGGDGLGSRSTAPVRKASPATTVVGFAALAGVLVVLSQVGEFNTWLYRAGFLGFSVLAAVLVTATVQRGPVARLLGWRPLAEIGKRSYAMYLWHWPIAAMTRPGVDLLWPSWTVLLLRVGLTMALTEASYRLVEQPVRRMGWTAYWHRVTGWRLGPVPGAALPVLVAAVLVAGICWPSHAVAQHQRSYAAGATFVRCPVDAGGAAHLPKGAPAGARCANAAGDTRHAPRPAPHRRAATHPAAPAPTPSASRPDRTSKAPHRTGTASAAPPPAMPAKAGTLATQHLVVYGDSVPLGAIPQLSGIFASVTNHAVEGIQAYNLLPGMIADGRAGRLNGAVVLLHTGDNGVIDAGQLRQALDAASGARRVIVATPHVPDPWQAPNVALIEKLVPQFRNAVLLNWNTDMTDGNGWVYPDGIHLTPAGATAYSRLVARAAASHG